MLFLDILPLCFNNVVVCNIFLKKKKTDYNLNKEIAYKIFSRDAEISISLSLGV